MDKIKQILDNPANKLICVDLDGTLCHGEYWHTGDEKEPEPNPVTIQLVKNLYLKGAHIIIWTARTPDAFYETLKWLVKHEVRFHGISMQRKPGADCYIDDKAINVEQFIEHLTSKDPVF